MPDIAKGVRSFTIGTAISRVMSLARESVFAFLFGAEVEDAKKRLAALEAE